MVAHACTSNIIAVKNSETADSTQPIYGMNAIRSATKKTGNANDTIGTTIRLASMNTSDVAPNVCTVMGSTPIFAEIVTASAAASALGQCMRTSPRSMFSLNSTIP